VRDVTSFKQAVKESGTQDVTVIADKGFGSKTNFELMEELGLRYIVPLRRNNGCFDRSKLKSGDKGSFDGHFMFQKRVIWFYEYNIDSNRYIVFQDSSLRTEEEKDYLQRIEANHEGYSMENYLQKQYDFGTILLRTNRTDSPEEIYKLYKTRAEIEQTFDFLKNLLGADVVYLQDKYAVEGWTFINHLSLLLVYLIYSRLRNANLLANFSVEDFICHLKYIHQIKINSSWALSEISGKTQKLLDKLGLSIT
jgi:transposase